MTVTCEIIHDYKFIASHCLFMFIWFMFGHVIFVICAVLLWTGLAQEPSRSVSFWSWSCFLDCISNEQHILLDRDCVAPDNAHLSRPNLRHWLLEPCKPPSSVALIDWDVSGSSLGQPGLSSPSLSWHSRMLGKRRENIRAPASLRSLWTAAASPNHRPTASGITAVHLEVS